jgi:hypothetical protein
MDVESVWSTSCTTVQKSDIVSDAIFVWTGHGGSAWPQRDENRLVHRFGSETAAELLPRLRMLQRDFYASDARDTAPDQRSLGDRAPAVFKHWHPELRDDAVEALAWCYTFDFK